MERNRRKWAHARRKPFFIFACLAALCVVMVFHSLTQFMYQDEELYVTAAYLTQYIRLYVDFLYVHPPIYPLVLSKAFMLFSSMSPFLVARLLSAALAIGSIVVFFGLAVRLSESERLATLLASLFASAPLMLLAYGWTRNDIMPIFFGLCGVWFMLRGLDPKSEQFRGYSALFLAGFCMALAVGAKVNAAFIPLTAMLFIFLRAKRKLLSLVLGGAVGSLPVVYYATTAFDKVFYCIVTFNLTAAKEFYTDIGEAEIVTWPYRMRAMMLIWVGEPALVVATLFITVVAVTVWRGGLQLQIMRQYLLADRIFIIFLMVAAVPFVFLPYPASKPYLLPAVPYVLLSCAALYPLAQRILDRRQALLFIAIAVVLLVGQAGRFAVEAVHHLNRSLWTAAEVHDLSVLIARHVKEGAVATLYPMLVLDAGTPIYPQFATGIFFFRSGDHLAPQRVLELNGISPRTLPLVLGVKPPAAVFIGNTPLDRPLLNWARQNCYIEVDLSRWQGGVYEKDGWKPRLFVRADEPVS
jgi:hypothetical protein